MEQSTLMTHWLLGLEDSERFTKGIIQTLLQNKQFINFGLKLKCF
jgi:hypothetical protein